jgi:single-strand DNA-binding protein
MNSFQLKAIGNLAKNPELIAKGDVSYTRLCVIGNDYAGRDEDGSAREIVTTLYFVAFGALGEAIASNARKGDQLILDARIRSDNWIDQRGEKQYDYSYVVEGFRFGAPGKARRDEFERHEGEATLQTASDDA